MTSCGIGRSLLVVGADIMKKTFMSKATSCVSRCEPIYASPPQITTAGEGPYIQLTADGFVIAVASFVRQRWTKKLQKGWVAKASRQPL